MNSALGRHNPFFGERFLLNEIVPIDFEILPRVVRLLLKYSDSQKGVINGRFDGLTPYQISHLDCEASNFALHDQARMSAGRMIYTFGFYSFEVDFYHRLFWDVDSVFGRLDPSSLFSGDARSPLSRFGLISRSLLVKILLWLARLLASLSLLDSSQKFTIRSFGARPHIIAGGGKTALHVPLN